MFLYDTEAIDMIVHQYNLPIEAISDIYSDILLNFEDIGRKYNFKNNYYPSYIALKIARLAIILSMK